MIYSLRKKFILLSAASISIAVFVIFSIMFLINHIQLDGMMDSLTDAIASNDGVFPEFDASIRPFSPGGFPPAEMITEETRFNTRFFTVWLSDENQIVNVNADAIFSISKEQTQEYMEAALKNGKKRGWVSGYRYKIFDSETGAAIVFVNGTIHHVMMNRFLYTLLIILVGSGLIVLFLIVVLSKRAVYSAAQSYEKQKEFITNANHELKTPLTLILSNLDIVESEVGKNEWLDDIRSEGERMGTLINQMVELSRMDEDRSNLMISRFDLSGAVLDTVSDFKPLAAERQKMLSAEIEPAIVYNGDEGLIRRLVSVLLDNAVKYCDPGGKIKVSVYKRRHPVLIVENTCRDVNRIEAERLFDRFYRADKARTFDGSFGVGLSIAQAIVKKHHGDISVHKRDQAIEFKAELK